MSSNHPHFRTLPPSLPEGFTEPTSFKGKRVMNRTLRAVDQQEALINGSGAAAAGPLMPGSAPASALDTFAVLPLIRIGAASRYHLSGCS